MLIIVGILMLLSLVILHELGHFFAAKRAGIEVEEFGIGFPPKAATIGRRNGTEYTLNWLPLGGFVKLKGEHDSDTEPGSFGLATLPQKVLVMVAGVVVNVLTAIVLLTIISFFGMPKVLPNQFSVASDTKVSQHDVILSIAKGSPAANATSIAPGTELEIGVDEVKLEDGDTLRLMRTQVCQVTASSAELVLDGNIDEEVDCLFRIKEAADVRPATSTLASLSTEGQPVVVTIERDGEIYDLYTTLLSTQEVEASKTENQVCVDTGGSECEPAKGYLGVVPSDYIRQKSTWSAPIAGVVLTGQFFMETLKGLGGIITNLFNGNASVAGDQVTGVVGIGYVLSELSAQGFLSVLFLTAIISISLAVMNILPIPALDGGRLFVTLLFRAINVPLTKKMEERIHGTGFAALMLLFVLITILDVQKFILN